MLDDFREWVSDNLRYILLGVAAILIIVIAVFAVRLIKGVGSSAKKEPETQAITENKLEQETEGSSAAKTGGANLVKDQPDILELMTKYYTARAGKDYDSMTELCEVFDDTARAEVESRDAAIESYTNIITYSKAGMTEGSYVVYVYFDAKLTGIDTLAPSLREWYLITNSEGKLVIAELEGNSELQSYIESMRTDDDVQALREDVDKKLESAKAQDENLKAFLDNGSTTGNSQGGDGDASGDNNGGDDGTASIGTMMVTTGVNVRGEPDASSTKYGALYEGATVEVLENLDSGWSHIRYIGEGGSTVEGYVMTQYLGAAQ